MPRRTQILTDLAKTAREMVEWLEGNPDIDATDLLFIENHLEMIHISYRKWKVRRRRAEAAISGDGTGGD